MNKEDQEKRSVATEEDGWVSVIDRMPEAGKRVLISQGPHCLPWVASRVGNAWMSTVGEYPLLCVESGGVHRWRLIPEEPKLSQEERDAYEKEFIARCASAPNREAVRENFKRTLAHALLTLGSPSIERREACADCGKAIYLVDGEAIHLCLPDRDLVQEKLQSRTF